MDATSRDAPRIVLFPPIIPLVTVVGALLLQWLLPLGILVSLKPGVRFAIAGTLLVAGIAMLLSAARALRTHGTPVLPSLPTVQVVTTGVFALTRNPMYVGGSLAMFGGAVLGGLDWVPLLYVLTFPLLHYGVVLPEEAYLERKFGDRFRYYSASVPRYLF